METTKDASIDALLARLDLPTRAWIVVDHWQGDLFAVGIATRRDPARLVYVSTFGKPTGLFDYECESPPSTADEAYRGAREGEDVDFDGLVSVLSFHLDGAPDA